MMKLPKYPSPIGKKSIGERAIEDEQEQHQDESVLISTIKAFVFMLILIVVSMCFVFALSTDPKIESMRTALVELLISFW